MFILNNLIMISRSIAMAGAQITLQFPNQTQSIPSGQTCFEVLRDYPVESQSPVVLARIDDCLCDLNHVLNQDTKIEWITAESPFGKRSYQQTLCLILIRAVHELFPDRNLVIDHSLGKGLYCRFENETAFTEEQVGAIKLRMLEIVASDCPIERLTVSREEALRLLPDSQLPISIRDKRRTVCLHRCGTTTAFMDYPLYPSTGYMKIFDLKFWDPGVILLLPEEENRRTFPPFGNPQKLFAVFQEYGHWEKILGVNQVAGLNKAIQSGEIRDLVKIAEGLHEKRMAQIADTITRDRRHKRIILIAGPSSSGKTTSTKRLTIQLRVNGLKPLSISLDDYFLDRDKTPLDTDGKPDFESVRALDVERFNKDLLSLLDGGEVCLPRFDFMVGKSVDGPVCRLGKDQPILIEGLHALNDALTPSIPKEIKFKLFVSALTQLNLTNHLRIPTSDVRFLRRLVRDFQFRGHSGTVTLEHWPKVRSGEEKYIFPFQEEADAIFNTSLFYELSVLGALAVPVLKEISPAHPRSPEAKRMLELLDYFEPIPVKEVPPNSILREFVGESSFSY